MPNYSALLNQARKIKKRVVKKKPKVAQPTSEITMAEWMIIGFVALIADLLTSLGFPFGLIILLWYAMRFHRFPTGKFIGFGLAEVASFGILPGWIGFVVITLLEQKGYMPKTLTKLTKAK